MDKDNSSNMQHARVLIAGGFASFLTYLTERKNPIVIGKGYPTERLLDAFYEWADLCKFDTDGADLNLWNLACSSNYFQKR